MKKLLSLAAITSLFVASQASAISYYSDVDLIGQKVTTSSSYSSDFNIVDNGGDSLFDLFSSLLPGPNTFSDGYNAATETITNAWAIFVFVDDTWNQSDSGWFSDEAETVEVDLGTMDFQSPIEVGFLSSVYGSISILTDLDEDGILGYTISSTQGDFKVLSAGLAATYEARPVSDSGTSLALLGLGLLGLVGISRRFSK